ncbi:MAG: hypothetical protein ACLPXZ_28785 [Mycobacterium sp.]
MMHLKNAKAKKYLAAAGLAAGLLAASAGIAHAEAVAPVGF